MVLEIQAAEAVSCEGRVMAKCEKCYGKCRIYEFQKHASFDTLVLVPCPECNGCGEQSCCQGHEAQPETEPDE